MGGIFRKLAVSAGAFAMLVTTAGPAAADGLHLINDDPALTWAKGCTATYSLDARVASEYGTIIPKALAYITPFTGVTFQQLGTGDQSAMIKYSMNDSLGGAAGSVYGLGSTDGTVQLAPVAKYIPMGNATYDNNLKQNLIIHETLHVFGLGHDDPSDSDEIMNPVLPYSRTAFGNGDLTGMQYIADRNTCSPSGQPPTPVTPEAVPTSSRAGSAFAIRTIKAFVPTSAIYMPEKMQTVVAKAKKLSVYAKSDGKTVYVKTTDGKWTKVPYKFTRNRLVYDEAQRLYLGLQADPLGGVIPLRVNG